MTALNPLLFFLSIAAGIAAWSLVFWIDWEWMQQGGHKRIFTFLASVRVFRYIGLVALVLLLVDEYVPLNLKATPSQLAENGWRVLINAFFVDVYIGGTQCKDTFGIPNKGQKYWLRHLFILETNRESKITKMIAFWNSADWYQQLGKTQLP